MMLPRGNSNESGVIPIAYVHDRGMPAWSAGAAPQALQPRVATWQQGRAEAVERTARGVIATWQPTPARTYCEQGTAS